MRVVLIMNGRLCFNLNKAPNCSVSSCQKFPFLLQTVVAFQLHCWLEWACSGGREREGHITTHTPPGFHIAVPETQKATALCVLTLHFSSDCIKLCNVVFLEKHFRGAHHTPCTGSSSIAQYLNISNKFLLFAAIADALLSNFYFPACTPSLDLPKFPHGKIKNRRSSIQREL